MSVSATAVLAAFVSPMVELVADRETRTCHCGLIVAFFAFCVTCTTVGVHLHLFAEGISALVRLIFV